MEKDSPVIYGLDFTARALAPVRNSESESIQFLVGTQSLRNDNQINLITFKDDEDHIHSDSLPLASVFTTRMELQSLFTTAAAPHVFGAVVNPVSARGQQKAVVMQLPQQDGAENTLKILTEVEGAHTFQWHPSSEHTFASAQGSVVSLHSFKDAAHAKSGQFDAGEGKTVHSIGWSPHHNGNTFAILTGSDVIGIDTRAMSANNGGRAFEIKSAHDYTVRTIDFNPNKQHYLVTGGDDGLLRVWDSRSTAYPLLQMKNHLHWVWCARYNQFHDQLVLSSSSDSSLSLSNIVSLSSDLYGNLDEDKERGEGERERERERESDARKGGEESEEEGHGMKKPMIKTDGVIATYDEHEDSVYAVEWSAVDPWVFASLSFDGRLIINRVPRDIKYSILL